MPETTPRPHFARRGRAAFFLNLTAGMTRREAARAAAIPFSTLYRWLEGEAFRDDCERAEAVCELTLVLRLQRAAQHGSVRAAMFLLERRYPERWGSKERLELSGPDGGPIAYSDMTDVELAERLARLRSIANEAARDEYTA